MAHTADSNDLLRRLIRQWTGDGDAAWSADAATAVWPALRRHRVEASLGALIPAPVLSPDQAAAVDAARDRTAALLMELERILPGLEAAGCAPILLKGAGLALTVYPDPLVRWFADLDLLVPRERLETACARLEALGYRPAPSRAVWAWYDRHHFHRILIGPRGSVVELHWDLVLPGSVYRTDLAGLRARAQAARLGRQACRVAAPVDQILHAVYQNIANGFVDLRRLLDLVVLTRSLDPAQWSQVLQEATAGRLDRGLELSLHIMKSIAGVPAPTLAFPRPLQPWAWRLLGGLDVTEGQLARRSESEAGYHDFVHLILVPGARLRTREVARMLWPRTTPAPGRRHGAARVLYRGGAGLRNLLRMAGYGRRAYRA